MGSARSRERAPAAVALALGLAAVLGFVGSCAAELRRLAVVPGKSEVTFTASFPLGDFTGRTSEVTGEFRADPSDLRQPVAGWLVVNPGALRTGVSGRDRDMYRALAVESYPEIRFTLERIEASFPSVTDRADVLLTLQGVLLIRGVERSMTFPARVRLRDERLWVRGEGELRMSHFGVIPPTKFFLAVKDAVRVAFDVTLSAE